MKKNIHVDYSIRCFIGRKRAFTDKLKKADAQALKITALHLAEYLAKEYKV